MSREWRPTLTTVALTSVTVTTSYLVYQLVSQYGLEGTFWYIWEGDPYPPNVREQFHALDAVEESLCQQDRLLDAVEEAYERAKLECVDEASDATILDAWNNNILSNKKSKGGNLNLERTLAALSYNLDKYAAQIDAVPSKGHQDIKPRKKSLSVRIVRLMQRTDIYVSHFKHGQQKEQRKDASK